MHKESCLINPSALENVVAALALAGRWVWYWRTVVLYCVVTGDPTNKATCDTKSRAKAEPATCAVETGKTHVAFSLHVGEIP